MKKIKYCILNLIFEKNIINLSKLYYIIIFLKTLNLLSYKIFFQRKGLLGLA